MCPRQGQLHYVGKTQPFRPWTTYSQLWHANISPFEAATAGFIHWGKLWINFRSFVGSMKTSQTGNKKWQSEIYLNLSGGSGSLSVIELYQLKNGTRSPRSVPVPRLVFNPLFPALCAPVVKESGVSSITYSSATKSHFRPGNMNLHMVYSFFLPKYSREEGRTF